MKRLILLVVALHGVSCGGRPQPQYFSCEGTSGIADDQAPLTPLTREITSSESPVRGSVRVDSKNVVVEGIPFLADTYLVCRTSDQSFLFSLLPRYREGRAGMEPTECSENETVGCGGPQSPCFELGMFNRVTGDFRYHVSGRSTVLYIMNCKKTDKLVR